MRWPGIDNHDVAVAGKIERHRIPQIVQLLQVFVHLSELSACLELRGWCWGGTHGRSWRRSFTAAPLGAVDVLRDEGVDAMLNLQHASSFLIPKVRPERSASQ